MRRQTLSSRKPGGWREEGDAEQKPSSHHIKEKTGGFTKGSSKNAKEGGKDPLLGRVRLGCDRKASTKKRD